MAQGGEITRDDRDISALRILEDAIDRAECGLNRRVGGPTEDKCDASANSSRVISKRAVGDQACRKSAASLAIAPPIPPGPAAELPVNVELVTASSQLLAIPPPVTSLSKGLGPLAELPLNVQPAIASEPELSTPPPQLTIEPTDELPVSVELVADIVPELKIPPPKQKSAVAELPLIVEVVIESIPELTIPPP